jgi:SAM-dependent methyltransferase
MTDVGDVLLHYGVHDLRDRLRDALQAAGLADGVLSPAELAPLDQFHTRGLAATVELAAAAEIVQGTTIVDVGSGLGGPSRYLAANFGCRVHGVDLSPAFVDAATYLARRAGLADKVTYECADATRMPFQNDSFDLAWTQHVAMNIADRARLYGEVHRVLHAGGRFAIYDVVAGEGGPLHFPVPWSRAPSTSFLVTPQSMQATLEQQGFRVIAWTDRTEAGVAWFEAQQYARAQAPAPPPKLGLHLAMGEGFGGMAANLGRNLREGRAGLIQAVMERR